MYRKLCLALLGCIGIISVRAQEVQDTAPEPEISLSIKEVLIEDEALDKAIERQKESVPSKMVISRKDLHNFGHHTAGDVLKRMPRIFVQGPPTFNRNIMMAGLDKQYQTVLIDGNRPAGGEDYRDIKLDRIPVDMIEDIEIIYNPPVDYGADAAVGVINIKLKDTPDERTITANLAAAHTSTYGGLNPEIGVGYGDSFNKFSFIVNYNINKFERRNINTITDGVTSGTEDEILDVTIQGFNSTLKYDFSEMSYIKLKSFFSDYHEVQNFWADIKTPGGGGVSPTSDTASDDKVRQLHTHTLEYFTEFNEWTWKNVLSYGQHIDTKDRWRERLRSTGLEESLEDERQRNDEVILNSDLAYSLGSHKLKAGLRGSGFWRDYYRMVYTKPAGAMFWQDITDGSYDLQEQRVGGYVSSELNFGILFIAPAVRLDYDQRSYTTIDDEGDFNYLSLNPSLHTKLALLGDFYIKADAARQISRPPFNSQVPVDKIKHKKATIERGNKELLPSRSWNFSLGAEKYFNNDSYFSVRGFHNIYRDVIEKKLVGKDPDLDYNIIQSVNVDSATVYGVDFDAHVKVLEQGYSKLSFNGNVSLLGSEVRDPTNGNMRRLNEQPRWMTNSSIDYFNSRLRLQASVGMNYCDERYIAGGTDEGTDVDMLVYNPFMQWDARIKYFFKPWGNIYINATNIFDEPYVITQGEVTESEVVGRDIRLGVSLTF